MVQDSAAPLTSRQIQHLRGLAHGLKVSVTIGANGLTEAVLREIEQAFDHHELIKIRLPATDRDRRRRLLDELCRAAGATAVQQIGRVGVAWRRSPQPRIALP